MDTAHVTPSVDYPTNAVPPTEHPSSPAVTPEELFMVDVRQELSAITDRLIAIERSLVAIGTNAAEAAEIASVFKQFGAAVESGQAAGINMLGR